MQTVFVSLDPGSASQLIQNEIVGRNITGTVIDNYLVPVDNTHFVAVLVLEKHYYRAGNRLTLTVTLDNMLGGKTRVHTCAGGGGEGLFRFDWGASESFEESVVKILRPYIAY